MEATMTRAEAFRAASEAFVPDPSDRPACVSFYRCWAGLRAGWGEEFVREHHHHVHQVACWVSDGHRTPEERYATALQILRDLAARAELPREPYHRLSYSSPPSEPTEEAVLRFAREQFKLRWPEKRINCNFAKEKIASVMESARELVQERYAEARARYDAEEAAIAAENAGRRAEWQTEVDRIHAFQRAVEALAVERAERP